MNRPLFRVVESSHEDNTLIIAIQWPQIIIVYTRFKYYTSKYFTVLRTLIPLRRAQRHMGKQLWTMGSL